MNKKTATLLEQHFDTAFAAPDGVAKLRELILTLAMQGRLVEQDPNDPPASELLKEIEAEKQRLIKEKNIKKLKPLQPIKPEEMPYELPQGWEWVKLGELADIIGGFAYKSRLFKSEGKNQVLRLGNIRPDHLRLAKNPVFIDDDIAESTRGYRLANDDILITMTGTREKKDYLYSVRIEENPINGKLLFLNQRIGAIRPFLNSKFLNKVVKVERFKDTIYGTSTGSANQANIGINTLREWSLPLPPLKEQSRIVARIDQLMARCDALEKLRKEQEEKRLSIHAAAIRGLLDASDGSAWHFIGQHFSQLYTVKENVAELRKAILQLAVMGCLVPQDPNDPPAGELLKEIKAEKQRLIKEKKIKKTKPRPPIKPEEAPYELPQGWEWIRFESLVLESMAGVDRGKKFQSKSNSHPYFKMNNISNDGKCDFTKVTKIDFSETENGFNKYILNDGDFLFNTRNSKELVGKTCIFKNPNNKRWYFNNNILRIIFHPEFIQQYANIWFLSPLGKTELEKLKSATTNVAAIYQGKLAVYPIPLPPLPEQHRIVARIDQLMACCDNLDQQIDAATNKQSELLNAVMAQI